MEDIEEAPQPSHPSIDYQLQEYGSVPPHDSRLLKILPTGFPLFEPVVLGEDDDDEGGGEGAAALVSPTATAQEKIEMRNAFLLKAERRVKRIVGSLDGFRHRVEKFFVVMDREIREEQMRRDPILCNQKIWQGADLSKMEALNEIATLQTIFSMAGYGESELSTPQSLIKAEDAETKKKQQQLDFVPSIQATTTETDWKLLAAAIRERQSVLAPCLKQTDIALKRLQSSLAQQKVFLEILRDIRDHWRVQKIPYAVHVYEKGDDYPYRAEIRVELFSAPTTCWRYNRPRNWALPGHLGYPETPLGSVTPAPFEAWPPLPAVPPTAPASAELFFTASARQTSDALLDDRTPAAPQDGVGSEGLRVQIRWLGDASFCTEAGRELSIRIVPIAIRPSRPGREQQVVVAGRLNDGLSPRDRLQQRLPSLIPESQATGADWKPESHAVHQRLRIAQWRLVDRAVHLIFQAEAARLKDALDVASFGSLRDAVQAQALLQEFEQLAPVLEVALPQTTGRAVKVKRNVTVERWETYRTSLAFRDLPVYGEDESPHLLVDLEIWINYLPTKADENDDMIASTTPPIRSPRDDANAEQTEPATDFRTTEFTRRLPIVEALAVVYLRHTFLTIWKGAVSQSPPNLDLFAPVTPSAPDPVNLMTDFVDWIQTYLTTRMFIKCPKG